MNGFEAYRVVHKIHLGGSDVALEVGQVVYFDGNTLKKQDGEEIKLSQPSALRGAIKVGWLVKAESETTTFTPKPAGVKVHSAQATGTERAEVNVMTVQDEERDVGNREEIRRVSSQRGGETVQFGAQATTRSTDEGIVVGRFKTSAKSQTMTVDGHTDRNEVRKLDNQVGVRLEKVAAATTATTGDVEEARSGDNLEDLLPNAASAGTPQATAGVPATQDGRIAALRQWAAGGQNIAIQNLFPLVKAALDRITELETASQETAPDEEPSSQKALTEWDTTIHWKKRQKLALEMYGDNPAALRDILTSENSNAVRKAVQARLDEISA